MRDRADDALASTRMAWVPNTLSVSRVPLSLALLAVRPFSALFFCIYLVCGLTDALDGYLARRHHVESQLGAKLDSVGDMTFFAVALYLFITYAAIPLLLIYWALLLVAVRMYGQLRLLARRHEFAMLHTYANKLCAFAFYCFPFGFVLFGAALPALLICCVGSLAVAEEMYINTHSTTIDLDIRSVAYLNAPREN